MWSLLFPPTCLGCGRIVRHDDPLALCTRCKPDQVELGAGRIDGISAGFAYQGPLSRAVVRMKFGGVLSLAGPLGRLLATHREFDRGWDVVVPVPLHWGRRLARGFDQTDELARWSLRHRRAPGPELASRALRRVRATQQQSDLDAHERVANVLGAFRVAEPKRIADRRVLVLDDVTTTGATLHACMRALVAAGASEVTGLALLRTLD